VCSPHKERRGHAKVPGGVGDPGRAPRSKRNGKQLAPFCPLLPKRDEEEDRHRRGKICRCVCVCVYEKFKRKTYWERQGGKAERIEEKRRDRQQRGKVERLVQTCAANSNMPHHLHLHLHLESFLDVLEWTLAWLLSLRIECFSRWRICSWRRRRSESSERRLGCPSRSRRRHACFACGSQVSEDKP
jgi:hypothetical protein